MKLCIIVVAAIPLCLAAQDPAQQGSAADLKKWHEQQLALGTARAASAAKRKADMEKTLVELDRREKALMQAFKDVFGQPHPQATDPRFIEETGETRRPRVEANDRSAARLDSIRREGQPSAILSALTIRKHDVEKWLAESLSLLDDWKRMQRNSESALRSLQADDNPSNPPDLKAYIKAWIDHFERSIRLERGSIDFETKRSNELRAELAELAKQIEAGTVK